jgi:phage tail sheath protein FI
VLDAPKESPEFEVPDFTALTRVATVALPTGGGGAGDGGDTPRAPRGTGGGAGAAQKSYLARQSSYGSQFFPWFLARNALLPNEYIFTPPSGAAAGIYSRVDGERGVHKAPANEIVRGAYNLRYRVTQKEQESLNTNGVNVIRFFGARGPVLWGARTRDPGEWKYTSVRRLFCMLEESIGRGTQWVVFEPNDETLWKSIRRDVEAFLMRMWRAGMLMGATPQQAFFVKCDAETNPQENIDAGIVTTMIGVAPVKPAEFVVFKIGQSSGGTEKVEAV